MQWEKPEIENGKLTRWNWMVSYPEHLTLGQRVDIGAFTYIAAHKGVVIEDDVQIGSHCSIYSISTIDGKSGEVKLMRNCRIGTHSTIMPGITVGENSLVGAFSFVNREIPSNVMAFGIPVKIIRMLSTDEISAINQEKHEGK